MVAITYVSRLTCNDGIVLYSTTQEWCSCRLASGDQQSVMGNCSRGVHRTDTNGITDWHVENKYRNWFWQNRRVFRRVDTICLIYLACYICAYIVFNWLSTQGKRKLWLRVSMVTGREPS